MTYSLHTLTSESAPDPQNPRHPLARFAQEIGLLLGTAMLWLLFMALVSYHPQDPAWSTSVVVMS